MNISFFEEFDQFTHQWRNLPSLPNKERYYYKLDDVGATLDPHRMIVITDRRTVLMYDSTKNPSQWTSLPSAPGLSTCTAAAIDGKLVIINEIDRHFVHGDDEFNQVYMLDVGQTTTWTKLPSTRRKLHSCTMVASGRHLYVFGNSDNCHSSQRLDVDSLTWEDLPSMPTKRALCTAAVVRDRIFVVGGTVFSGNGNRLTDMVEVFDTKKLVWDVAPSMPKKSCRSAAATIGSFIFVTGGVERPSDGADISMLDITQVYDCVSRCWKIFPVTMSTARAFHVAGFLNERRLVIAGGIRSLRENLDSVEEIVLVSTWSIIRHIVMLRWLLQQHRATLRNVCMKKLSKYDIFVRQTVSGNLPDDIFIRICSFL